MSEISMEISADKRIRIRLETATKENFGGERGLCISYGDFEERMKDGCVNQVALALARILFMLGHPVRFTAVIGANYRVLELLSSIPEYPAGSWDWRMPLIFHRREEPHDCECCGCYCDTTISVEWSDANLEFWRLSESGHMRGSTHLRRLAMNLFDGFCELGYDVVLERVAIPEADIEQ